MKVISWNIHGLNGTHKQEVIRNMIRDHRPKIMVIQETKMKKINAESIRFSKILVGVATNFEGPFWGLLTLYHSKFFGIQVIYEEGNILFTHFIKVDDIHS